MIKPLLMAPLLLALALGRMPVAAQSSAAETQQASPEPTSAGGNTNDTAEQAVAPEGTAQTKTPPTTRNDSPFDYRSSEKISEDVPVSFPVDI